MVEVVIGVAKKTGTLYLDEVSDMRRFFAGALWLPDHEMSATGRHGFVFNDPEFSTEDLARGLRKIKTKFVRKFPDFAMHMEVREDFYLNV